MNGQQLNKRRGGWRNHSAKPGSSARRQRVGRGAFLAATLLAAAISVLPSVAAAAQLAEFSVATGVGPSAPTSVKPGASTTLRITLTNASAAAYEDVAFSQSLTPAGNGDLRVAGAAVIGGSAACAGTVTLPATGESLSVQLSGMTVPARSGATDGQCWIDIPVTAASSDGESSTQTYVLGPDSVHIDAGSYAGDSNGSGAGQGITILAAGRPTWSKSFGATAGASGTAILGGASIPLTLKLNNPADGVPLSGVGFEDLFPVAAGEALIEPDGTAAVLDNCGGGSAAVLTTGAAAGVSVTGVSLGAGQSCTVTVNVKARHTAEKYELSGQVNELIPASFRSDQGLRPGAEASAKVTVRSPLQVSKEAVPERVASGEDGTFKITLKNNGQADLVVSSFGEGNIDGGGQGGARLTPTAFTNSCGGTNSFSNTAGGGFQTGDYSIPAGGSCTITVTFTGTTSNNTPLAFTNTIPEAAVVVGGDGIISQPQSAVVTLVDELFVDKARAPQIVVPGSAVKYTVTVSNFGAAPRNGVHVTDGLQNGSTFLTGVIDGSDYSPTVSPPECGLTTATALGASNVDLVIGSLPAAAGNTPGQCAVSFWVMTDPGNPVTTANQIAECGVWYGSQTAGSCNGSASNKVNTNSRKALEADKTFNGTDYSTTALSKPEGTVVTMRIRVRNYSTKKLANLAIADTFPAAAGQSLRVANPANASTTCGGSIDADPGTTSLALNGAEVPAASVAGNTITPGTCTLQVDVVGAAGVYDNQAQVTATQNRANGDTAHTVTAATNVATLTYTGALEAEKSFEPSSMTADGRATVRIRLRNTDPGAHITAIEVTDPLPAAPNGLQLADPPNIYSSCAGTPSYGGAPGASQASMSGASLGPGASCDFLFDVVSNGDGNGDWVNSIPPGGIRADGGIRNQAPVAATLRRVAPQTPVLSKAIVPSAVAPGETARLTITITNGSQALTGLGVSDLFTEDGREGSALTGIRIAPVPNAVTSCSGGLVTAEPGASRLELAGATLDGGASCTVEADVIATNPGAVGNTIPYNSIRNDQGQTNTGTFAYAPLTTSLKAGVAKGFSPAVVKVGERARLRITFYNGTAVAMANVSITDQLPVGMTVAPGPNVVHSCGPATQVNTSNPARVLISGASLVAARDGVSASCHVELDVVVAAAGKYLNTLQAQSLEMGGKPTLIPEEPVSAELNAVEPLVVHKAIDGRTLDGGNPAGFATASAQRGAGEAATMSIVIHNPNALTLSGASFVDPLPAGMVVALDPNAGTTCADGVVTAAASATSVRLTGATLAPNASCSVTVDVLSNNPGSYVNSIGSGEVTTREGVSNEERTRAELIIAAPPTLAKQFSPAVIAENGVSTLTIFLGNDNASALTLEADLVDVLPTAPGTMTVAAVPNLSTSCPDPVAAAGGAATVTYAAGSTIPPGGCSITVDVAADAAGDYNNNIAAGALRTNGGSNADPANATLKVSTRGYIAGKVFADNDLLPDGLFNNGDEPLAGVLIELHAGNSCGSKIAETTTDVLGNYLFAGLNAGSYTVCQPGQPEGTANGHTTAGSIRPVNGSSGTPGTGSNPSTDSSRISNVVLEAAPTGEVSGAVDNNFAEIRLSSISGKVFIDHDNDGEANGVDRGLGGEEIRLTGTDVHGNAVERTTITDAEGNYRFDGLLPGTYDLFQPGQPHATANGKVSPGGVDNGGSAGSGSNPSPGSSQISGIVLPPNTAAQDNNFAELPQDRSIAGQVFLDFNGNGAPDGDDHGIGGEEIRLVGTDVNGNAVERTAITDADGNFRFDGLPEGSYTLIQPRQPAGTDNGATTAGSSGSGSNPGHEGVNSSQIAAVDLSGSNKVSVDNLFAELPGNAPDLAIGKTHSPAEFAEGGGTGYFTITSTNIGKADTAGEVQVVDRLPPGMQPKSAGGEGWSCTLAAQTVSCTTNEVIAANGGRGQPIIVHVDVSPGQGGQLLVNDAEISGGGEPEGFRSNNRAQDPTPIIAAPDAASVAGHVWRDHNHDRILDSGEQRLPGWTVELLYNGVVVASAVTAADGGYQFTDLPPGSGYQLRFVEPDTGMVWGHAVPNERGASYTSGVAHGTANPAGATVADGMLNGMTLLPGANVVEQSLPLDPSGIVYDAVTRQPVAGAVVSMSGPAGFDPALHLVGGRDRVITGSSGMYQFILALGAPAGAYRLEVTTYPAGYLPLPSTIIPPCTAALGVGATPAPALVQSRADAPDAAAPAHEAAACPPSTAAFTVAQQASTQYFLEFQFTPGVSADLINNHIALDPVLGGAIRIVKTSPLVNVSKGGLVPYTVTATNTLAGSLRDIAVVDQMPPGFKYRSGSGSVRSGDAGAFSALEPQVSGRNLRWAEQSFAAGESKTYRLVLVVGAGVGEGEYTNLAWAMNDVVAERVSNIGSAVVRVIPDPLFDCSDIIGTVFDDRNANGYQDEGEPGIPNVRVVTARGLLVTTDAEGRFHVSCADIPNRDRGSNFVMKLDERTLPSGYRVTTENPRDVRTTRGKMVKLNFGATIHKLFRIEVDDRAFAGEELAEPWEQQLQALVAQLAERPAVVRLAYRASAGTEARARSRLDQLGARLQGAYRDTGQARERPPLIIETEIIGAAAGAQGVQQ